MEAGNSSCLEDLVFGNEVVGFINAAVEGIEVTPYTLAEDVIEAVGPGGSFFGEEQTVKHVRDFWKPSILKSQGYDQWVANGKQDMDARAKEQVRQIIAKGPQNPLSDDIVKELEAIIAGTEKRARGNPGTSGSTRHK